ncbi:MAG: type IX secretion system sortase PorU [Bacteroidaceae bacterium]|nr:type IX secretion system sortase PorU [Bacteroidaceae bacterium]
MRNLIRYCLLAVAVFMAAAVEAQQRITYLDWNIIAADTLAPVYGEVVPLESDYRLCDYRVAVEYPVWGSLTPGEMTLARKYASLVSDTLDIEQYVTVSRGRGMLNYSFVPIVRKNGRYRKLLSAKISIIPVPRVSEARARSVLRAGAAVRRYADHSVLAQGTWRAIHITSDGMYRMTPSFLSSMGFKDPGKVHLYGYGGHQQDEVFDMDSDYDDLEEVPLYVAPDGSLLFWGNGLVHWQGTRRIFNSYARQATYFLTEGEARRDIVTEEQYTGPVSNTIQSCLAHRLYEVDDFAWFRGGRNLYDASLFSGYSSRTYTLKDVNSLGNEKVSVSFTASKVTTPLAVYLNDSLLGRRTIYAPGSFETFSTVNMSNVGASGYSKGRKDWTFRLVTGSQDYNSSQITGRLDYISLSYTAPLELADGYVRFGGGYSGTGSGTGSASNVTETYTGATTFSNITAAGGTDVKVMRLGRRGRGATLVQTAGTGGTVQFSVQDGTDDFVAFDPSYQFPQPVAGAHIDNQDLHASEDVDMVIIVPSGGQLTSQAQRLADAHAEYQGLKCMVVSADKIYNEFSSGTPDASAYRRFMKMLYDRGLSRGAAPRYLLLFGDCAWDNRMRSADWRSSSPANYLLCCQSEESSSDESSYCWEDYFGLMDDGEGGQPTKDVSDLGIGRFPVTTATQARIMVDKTISHMAGTYNGEWKNQVLFVGDDGDDNEHMRQSDAVAGTFAKSAPDVDVRKVMLDSYVRRNEGLYYTYPEVHDIIGKAVTDGALMINYTGHASTYLLSSERVVLLDDVRTWKSNRLPLWYTAACDTQPFDSKVENLGEEAVLSEGGGAVAFIGTTHTAFSRQNFYLNNFFCQNIMSTDGNGNRYLLGDALRMAKGSMSMHSTDSSRPYNKLQYCLLGDPALLMGNPLAKVVLDSINGEALTGSQQLKAGGRVRISGHVEGSGGEVDTQFTGVLAFRLYDNMETITTRGNSGNKPFRYNTWNKEIINGTDSIRAGRFSTGFVMPRDINYSDENGRLVMYAVTSDNSREANGSSENFLVGGTSHELDTDTIGPSMYIYLNEKDFCNGDVVNSTPLFVAELSDEAGIQSSGNGLGHDLELVVDGMASRTYNLNSYFTPSTGDYTKGTVCFADMDALEPGAHTLTFRAWDMLNNTSVQTLDFVVGENLEPDILNLVLENDILSGGTVFRIAYSYPGLMCHFKLEVFAINGMVQYRHEFDASDGHGVVSVPWSCCNGSGTPLNNGIYAVRVTASYNGGKTHSRQKKFVLWRNN